MKTVVVVNGEQTWQEYLPGYHGHYCRLQNSKWLYRENQLWLIEQSGMLRVDGVLWRVGAIRPHPNHRTVLELIRLAQIPCLNPVSVLLRCFDRLSMLNEMREAGLPVIPFSVAMGDQLLDRIEPELPIVMKIGNYHAGYGKAKIVDADQWQDIKDVSFVVEDYITLEPFVEYVADIRCLAIGDQLWAMNRRGSGWKANTGTIHYQLIPVPPILEDLTFKAMTYLGADIPGLSGFPDEAITAVARCMRTKMEQSSP